MKLYDYLKISKRNNGSKKIMDKNLISIINLKFSGNLIFPIL